MAAAANSAHELVFKIGERNMIGPLIGVDACPMQATKIGAVHDEPVNARRWQLAQCHLLAVHRFLRSTFPPNHPLPISKRSK